MRIAIAFCMFVLLSSLTPLSAETTNTQTSTQPKMRTQSDIPETPVGSGFFFQPRVWTGAMNLKHDASDEITTQQVGKPSRTTRSVMNIQSTMPVAGIGATLVYKKFFLDAYVQKQSSNGEDQSIEQYQLSNTLSATTTMDYQVEREDYSASLGYRVTDRLLMFAGYRMGQTSYGILTKTALNDGKTTPDRLDSYQFKAEGPFLGLSYSYPLFEHTQLSFNVGYAKLEGDYSRTANGEKTQFGKNSTNGITYGINWRGSLYKKLGYSFSVDQYGYKLDKLSFIDSESVPGTTFDHNFNLEEELLTFKFTLSYTF